MTRKKFLQKMLLALGRVMPGLIFLLLTRQAEANPTGMTVQSGHASASASGSRLTVTAGNNAVLNWQSFNIAAGETTVFRQPTASSVVWNQIGGQSPSQIYGSLQANGIVVLLNSSGFYFGPNSFVGAAGLVVSTANCAPPQNAGGTWQFNGPPPLASIVNYGQMQMAHGGSCFLIADQVENYGTIEASGGSVGLASGKTVMLSERADGRGLSMSVTLPQGSVDNYGTLVADAGIISLNAKVVNQDGFIQANSVQEKNGVIELVAGDQLNLGANSTISAQGDASASGSAGGNITLKSANHFSDASGSEISVAGGINGGNGGTVEISAPVMPAIHSTVIGSARAGFTGGKLLLDPDYIILDTSGGDSVGAGGSVGINDDPGGTLDLNVNTAFSGFSQITLQAVNDITLADNTSWSLSDSTGQSSGQLVLEAGRNIIFGNSTLISDANNWSVALYAGVNNFAAKTVAPGAGSIYLNASDPNNPNESPDNPNGSIQTTAGDITMVAGQDIAVGSGAISATGAGNILATASAGSVMIDSGSLQTGSGNINLSAGQSIQDNSGTINTLAGGSLSAVAGTDISFGGTVATTGKGNITANATTGNLIINSDSFQTDSGNIDLTAGQGIQDNAGSLGSLSGGNISAVASTDISIAGAMTTIDKGTIAVETTGGSLFIDPGFVQTSAGTIELTAAQDITVGGGRVTTIGGGSITAHALAGNINTGTDAQGYTFQSADSASGGYVVDPGVQVGGISTTAGGDVNMTAGGDVISQLPSRNPTANSATAGSGAYGFGTGQTGNVNIIAGGDVTGNYLVANGTGKIFAGVLMDASGNPVKDASGNYVLSNPGSAGTSANSLALNLISGGWNVSAGQDIYLQEVRNPNGDFNNVDSSSGAFHAFDYAASDYVNLTAGNLVQLGGSAAVLPRLSQTDGLRVPVIYPGILNISAGAGGVDLTGDSTYNQLILYPSAQGGLVINTTGGGSLLGNLPTTGGSPQVFNLIVSDSGHNQYNSSGGGLFGLNDHAATPIHDATEDPVQLNISGDMDLVLLGSPEAAQINVVGNMYNSGFRGMNLKSTDVTSITVGAVAKANMEHSGILDPATDSGVTVGGDLDNRSAFTSVMLGSSDAAPDLSQLANASGNSINGTSISASTLLTSFFYNSTTKVLTYQNIPGVALSDVLNLLQNLSVSTGKLDAGGNPQTTQVSVINTATAGALLQAYNDLNTKIGAIPTTTPGYVLGGGGTFDVTAANMDLGTTAGIQSFGVGLYKVGGNYPLAKYSSTGADIDVNLTGDLTMYSTSIASLNGGNIFIHADGSVNVGSPDFTVTALGARGIFTSASSDVTVIAGGDVDVNGSRIAAYDGGDVTVESLDGNINAGTGGSGFVFLSSFKVDPTTHAVVSSTPTIPGSGILATTFPFDKQQVVGNILVETPNGDINASSGGIIQLPLNSAKGNSKAIVEVLAGYELQDGSGHAVYAANLGSGTPVKTTEGKNVDASGSGIIGENVVGQATGVFKGVVFGQNNVSLTAPQFSGLTVLGQTVEAQGNLGAGVTLIGTESVDTSGSSGSANILSQNANGGGSSFAQGTVANSTSSAASASDTAAAAAAAKTDTGEDDPLKKKKSITLARKISRVTVLLPGRN